MRILIKLALGVALTTAMPALAQAATYAWTTCYETVTCYETRYVAQKFYVTKYDHCGKAYAECVTVNKIVKVPVNKVVAVRKYVKVCD